MNTQNIYNNNNKDININSNTKVKICGLTSPAEARYLNENHVDFAGMVLFFPKSKRNISIEQAKEVMAALDASIKRVAVVVSPSIEQVRQIEAAGFNYIQIHGEIPETEAEAAIAIPILKAFNVSDMGSYEKYHNVRPAVRTQILRIQRRSAVFAWAHRHPDDRGGRFR